MMANTAITWTNKVWNPVTGCTKVSQGCRHCYAERLAKRLQAMGQPHYANGFEVTMHPDALELPLHWRKPAMIFVNSMSDLFHDKIPDSFIQSVFSVMEKAKQHTFQVLTKRAERMQQWVHAYHNWLLYATQKGFQEKHPNVWLGVSVEDGSWADMRIPRLLYTPAAVRFVSCEPLLGPMDLSPFLKCEIITGPTFERSERELYSDPNASKLYTARIRPRLDWVIVGGESGPGHRPLDIAWVRETVEQCKAAGVACFVKQDSGPRPGCQGRIPDELWIKEFPK